MIGRLTYKCIENIYLEQVDDVRLSTVGRKEFVKLSEAVAEETERCAWRHDLVLEQLRRKADTQLVNALLGERAEKVVLAGLQNQAIHIYYIKCFVDSSSIVDRSFVAREPSIND